MHLPFDVDSSETGLYFSTLDYIGRPVLTITKKNVYKFYHDHPFQVSEKINLITTIFRFLMTSKLSLS